MDSLRDSTVITRVMAAQAAGTDDAISTDALDMATPAGNQFNGVTFLVMFGAITATAVTTIKVQQSSDDAGADDYSDIEGTEQSVADDDDGKVFYVDVLNPDKRYLELVVTRATANAVIDGVIALQYGARRNPVTQTVAGERHQDKLEGTA